MRKHIILITSSLILLTLLATGVGLRLNYLNKRHSALNAFYEHKNTLDTDTNITTYNETVYYKDDFIGWYFYNKKNQLYMSVNFYTRDENNKKIVSQLDFPMHVQTIVLDSNSVSCFANRIDNNTVQAQYKLEDNILLDITLAYNCQGSCGEYFPTLSVTDTETSEIYYTNDEGLVYLPTGIYTLERSKDSVDTKFTITILDDETFVAHEAAFSSRINEGSYSVDGDILTLSEEADGYFGSQNHFRITDDGLVFISKDSTNYPLNPLENNDLFIWTSNVE